MKLSRRGWNNVIIFSVASMILIFKFIERQEQQSPSLQNSVNQLLPQGATILRMELPGLVIERVGTEWRSQPAYPQALAVVDAWSHIQLEPWQQAIGGAAQSQGIRTYIAASAEPIDLTLFELGEQRYITSWQGQLLQLDDDSYQALFPHLAE